MAGTCKVAVLAWRLSFGALLSILVNILGRTKPALIEKIEKAFGFLGILEKFGFPFFM